MKIGKGSRPALAPTDTESAAFVSGATTLGIMTLNVTAVSLTIKNSMLSITTLNAECRAFIAILGVDMMSVASLTVIASCESLKLHLHCQDSPRCRRAKTQAMVLVLAP